MANGGHSQAALEGRSHDAGSGCSNRDLARRVAGLGTGRLLCDRESRADGCALGPLPSSKRHELWRIQPLGRTGAHDKSIDALVRAVELKSDGERSWRERLLVLARTQPPEAQFKESLRNAPFLERKVAWQQAKATYPGIEALTGNAQEHVKDAIIAGSLPTLRRRVVLAQWALALEHELIKRVFEPFRTAHSQAGPPSKGRWTLSRWLAGGTQDPPSLGDMRTCLVDKWRDPSHQDLHRWVQGRFDWLLDKASVSQIKQIVYARNNANHPQPLDDPSAESASATVRELLARLCASSRAK